MWPLRIAALSGGSLPAYLASLGLSAFNAGADYNRALYWLPSTADSASAPRWASEAEWFAQFTRAGTATYTAANGNITTAAANEPRFDWSTGRRRLLLEGASTRISAWPITPQTNWGISGAGTKTAVAGTFIGVFENACQFASGGADWHRLGALVLQSITSGATLSWSAYYRAGSSGRAKITLRNNTAATETVITGVVGGLSVTGSLSGSATITEQRVVADGSHIIKGTWTPNANGTAGFGIGPDTATVGQTIIVLGGMLETASAPGSLILGDGSVSVTRAVDRCELPAAMKAVLQRDAATALVRGRLLVPNASGASRRVLGLTGSAFLLGAANSSENVARSFNGSSSLDATFGSGNFMTGFGEVVAFDGSGRSHCVNGGAVTSDPNGVGNRSTVYLGRDEALSNLPGAGLYDIVAVAPSRLSNSVLQALAVAA